MKSRPFTFFFETAAKFVFLIFASLSVFVFSSLAQNIKIEKTSVFQNLLSQQTERNLKVFDVVRKTISERYYDRKFNGIDWEKTTEKHRPQIAVANDERELYRALKQMLAELRDAHTTAFSPTEAARKDNTKKNGTSVGIGMRGTLVENRFVITHVWSGSPAAEAGVEIGQILLRWNGEPFNPDLVGEGRYETAEGQSIRLEMMDNQDQMKTLTIMPRAYSALPLRQFKTLENGEIYLRFDSFAPGTGEWLTQLLAQNQNAATAIIDLRGNAGGLLGELKKSLKPLFDKEFGTGEFIHRDGGERELKSSGFDKAFRGQVIVLTDASSASSSEIFASAIKESGRGIIIGRKTAGQVLASIETSLPDGGKLKFSIRDYKTLSGRRLEGQGVEPNVTVELKLWDLRAKRDTDIEKALEIARRKS
jgi:carboxyl-terminal processing protease